MGGSVVLRQPEDIELPPCKGRTWFDAIVEGWHNQSMMRLHMEGLHVLELARAAKPPVVEVTVADLSSPVRKYTIDPSESTVVWTMARPGEQTGPMPRGADQTMDLPVVPELPGMLP